MAEQQWTPGPWRRMKDDSIMSIPTADTFLSSWRGLEPGTPRYPVHSANLDLIAAAPELYEALQMLFEDSDEADACYCMESNNPMEEFSPCLPCVCRAALMKARGERAE